ncbi:DNA primase small subunit [Eumeta japonica]|uniref:DNA primase small subunit n=1 Tax=Eumeta variegata TaxID=151549 RepID=A0A4C1UP74_EUMVA|nr:DNA primase small subunit [Eumeta japonica]
MVSMADNRRAICVIDSCFEDILNDQEFISTKEGLKKMLSWITNDALCEQVEKALEKMAPNSLERWNMFLRLYESFCKENVNGTRKIKYLVEEIKLQYCYPRLDVNVTKGFNHLLKSPFSIHPKTGKVSIVFKPNKVRNMKLDEVPTISSLLDENFVDNPEHQATMRAAIKNFQEVVFTLEKTEALRRKNESRNKRRNSRPPFTVDDYERWSRFIDR